MTTHSERKVEVEQAARESARDCVLVAAASTFGTFGRYRVAPLGAFGTVITGSSLTEAAEGPAPQARRPAGRAASVSVRRAAGVR